MLKELGVDGSPKERAKALRNAEDALADAKRTNKSARDRDTRIDDARARRDKITAQLHNGTVTLAEELERRTNLESRVTILGHVQRGGTPSAADRLLATRLGAACLRTINEGAFGVMIAAKGEETRTVPLSQVVGRRKTVPLDHSWIRTARMVGVSLGDAS